MNVKIVKGESLILTDTVTCHRLYGYRTPDNLMTADVTIEIDYAGLIDLVKKAAHNKSKRTKDGPVTIKLKNIQGPL